ncbi:LysR family transcriptional regulator [Amaricoccus sp.]|uniref:LysR family transcriptional regulator n=1 Tax=Amaricoccus sp. TaxID=1872485 RepID=UPI001B422A77|nr:LysR family transcriptional regulator [Amaricoccus sp.]MBP7001520.1 LysR family transcriptional regulator [Amaricoccus sp.]
MPDLPLRQVEVIRAAMMTGAIQGAAELLHVSSPGISRLLEHTEESLGGRPRRPVPHRRPETPPPPHRPPADMTAGGGPDHASGSSRLRAGGRRAQASTSS